MGVITAHLQSFKCLFCCVGLHFFLGHKLVKKPTIDVLLFTAFSFGRLKSIQRYLF